jgi:hypothetical protein
LSACCVVLILTLVGGPLAQAGEGSVLGQVTVTKGGKAATVDPSWKVQFIPAAGGQPIDAKISGNVYEIAELSEGLYTVQLVDVNGFAIGEPKPNVLIGAGTNRVDVRAAMQDAAGTQPAQSSASSQAAAPEEGGGNWKVWVIVGGAAAALALVAGGDDDPPASSPNP